MPRRFYVITFFLSLDFVYCAFPNSKMHLGEKIAVRKVQYCTVQIGMYQLLCYA